MAVARRPATRAPAQVDALIERGGSVPSQARAAPDGTAVPLRLPRSLLTQIDRAVAQQRVKVPRNTWLLHAVVEKLERDGIE